MRGWFKLIETIRQTDPPLTSIESPSPPTLTMETNGHRSIALESLPSQSPTDLPSPLALSTPSPPPAPIEPTPTRAGQFTEYLGRRSSSLFLSATKRSSTRPKRITIRKSTRSKEVNPSKNDSVLPDRPPAKRLSHDHSSNGSIIPFATDLYNLPGHHHRQDDSRDDRFLHYFDMNSLSMHLNACLYIEKRSSFSFTKQHIFKTRHNILSKIFKLDYIKTLQRHVNADEDLFADGTEGSEPRTASSTALSFQTDWSINRRSSSVSRHARKNFFHDLQLNPKRQLFATTEEDHRTSEGQQRIDVECIKDILLRTYYPHLHDTIAFGDSFGAKAKLLNKHEAFSNDEGMTKMLKCPLVTAQSPSITLSPRGRGRKRKHQDVIEKPAPIITMPRRVSEEIPPVPINESVLVSTPSKPLNHRHKRSVANNNDNLKKSKRKRFVSPPSPAQRTISPSERLYHVPLKERIKLLSVLVVMRSFLMNCQDRL